MRRGEQAIHGGAVGGLAAAGDVGEEGGAVGGRGREADEIEAHAAQPRLGGGVGAGGDSLAFQTGEDEAVDGPARPRGGADLGEGCALRR